MRQMIWVIAFIFAGCQMNIVNLVSLRSVDCSVIQHCFYAKEGSEDALNCPRALENVSQEEVLAEAKKRCVGVIELYGWLPVERRYDLEPGWIQCGSTPASHLDLNGGCVMNFTMLEEEDVGGHG